MADQTGEFYLYQGDYLSLMALDLLWPLRKKGDPFSAELDICPRLLATPGLPHHRQIAEAVCLILDQHYDEAVEYLGAIDASLGNPPLQYNPQNGSEALLHNEKLNLPLYIAAARFLQGYYLEEGGAALGAFYTRNANRPYYVSSRILRIVHAMENGPGRAQRNAAEVTGFLINSGFTSDPVITSQLPRGHARHLLDLHMGSYFRQRHFEFAKPFCELVLEDYDPQDEASNNSLFCLGIIYRAEQDFAAAEQTFLGLANSAAPEKWRRAATSQLAETWMDMGRPPGDVAPLLGPLSQYASPQEANFYRYPKTIERYEEELAARAR